MSRGGETRYRAVFPGEEEGTEVSYMVLVRDRDSHVIAAPRGFQHLVNMDLLTARADIIGRGGRLLKMGE